MKLKRTKNKVVAGVCGGIAEYLGWSAPTTRLLYLILVIFTVGSPILVYLILWVLMPEE